MKVVIIDDDRLVRETLLSYLENENCETHVAADGDEGIRLVHNCDPDVVVTDILMPNKEGMETITELKKSHPDVRIIAISGQNWSGFSSYLDMASRLGAHAVLSKPFTRREFIDAVLDLNDDASGGVELSA